MPERIGPGPYQPIEDDLTRDREAIKAFLDRLGDPKPDPGVIHVHHHDIEQHARSYNEGYAAAGAHIAAAIRAQRCHHDHSDPVADGLCMARNQALDVAARIAETAPEEGP